MLNCDTEEVGENGLEQPRMFNSDTVTEEGITENLEIVSSHENTKIIRTANTTDFDTVFIIERMLSFSQRLVKIKKYILFI